METTAQPALTSPENEFLQNSLARLRRQYAPVQVFYTPGQPAQLLIHVSKKGDADALAGQKWVRRALLHHKVNVCALYTTRLDYLYKMGHPFVLRHCTAQALLHEDAGAGDPLQFYASWKASRKKMRGFKDGLQAERANLRRSIGTLAAEKAVNSVLLAYERLLAFHVGCLEELQAGAANTSQPLGARIAALTAGLPGIGQWFVGKKPGQYYLLELFGRARQSIEEEETGYDDDLFEALSIAESGLSALVDAWLAALAETIKKESRAARKIAPITVAAPCSPVIATAVQTITRLAPVEQIYCFHQAVYGEARTVYLLLLGQGLGSELLERMAQSLAAKAGPGCHFVLLGHSRYWLQKNLFHSQSFFSRIVCPANLVYESGPFHPQLHWIVPHHPYHADLFLYYRAAMQNARQFKELADGAAHCSKALACLFALSFLSFCKAYTSACTHYLPAIASARALWGLCLYADAKLYRFQHLFDGFDGDFFAFVDKHASVLSGWHGQAHPAVTPLQAIVSQLEEELHRLVIEGGLFEEPAQG